MLDKKLDGNARASHILISFKNEAHLLKLQDQEDARKESREY